MIANRRRGVVQSAALRCSRVVLVFARLPRDEREAKPLVVGASSERVEAFHRAMLRRALAVAAAAGTDVRLVTTGADADLAAPGVEIVRQIGDSFAERLDHAVADAFAAGWTQVVVIGADAPALTGAHLREAFVRLETSHGKQAIFGPASDGGYYLLGLNAFDPAAFRGIPLGTSEALRATGEALARAGFRVDRLPATLDDLDDHYDLFARARLSGALRRLALALLSSLRGGTTACTSMRSRITIQSIHVRGPPVLA